MIMNIFSVFFFTSHYLFLLSCWFWNKSFDVISVTSMICTCQIKINWTKVRCIWVDIVLILTLILSMNKKSIVKCHRLKYVQCIAGKCHDILTGFGKLSALLLVPFSLKSGQVMLTYMYVHKTMPTTL